MFLFTAQYSTYVIPQPDHSNQHANKIARDRPQNCMHPRKGIVRVAFNSSARAVKTTRRRKTIPETLNIQI